MMRKLVIVLCLFLIGGYFIYDSIDKRIGSLETAGKKVQKQLNVLGPGQTAPEGSKVLDGPFKPQDLADIMSGGERAVYIRAFTGLTGGTTGKLDKISNADLDDNDLALVFDIGGDYSAGAMLMYYWDEDVDYTEVVPRYIESDTDGGTSGTWILMNGWVSGPSASPTVSFYDSDGAGTDEWADLLVGHITMTFDTVTEAAETGDFTVSIMMGGTEVNIIDWDATGETMTFGDSSTGEDLIFDFDTGTANEVKISSNSAVDELDFSAINLVTTGNIDGSAGKVTVTTSTSGDQTRTVGQLGLKTDEDLLVTHGGAAGEVQDEVGISLIQTLIVRFDPEWEYDTITNHTIDLMEIRDEAPHGITITEWKIEYVNGDPTTEIDMDIVCDSTPDWNPAAGATVMDVIDTTAGSATADTGFDSATCANGSNLYLRFGADPVDSGEVVRVKIQYYLEED